MARHVLHIWCLDCGHYGTVDSGAHPEWLQRDAGIGSVFGLPPSQRLRCSACGSRRNEARWVWTSHQEVPLYHPSRFRRR